MAMPTNVRHQVTCNINENNSRLVRIDLPRNFFPLCVQRQRDKGRTVTMFLQCKGGTVTIVTLIQKGYFSVAVSGEWFKTKETLESYRLTK